MIFSKNQNKKNELKKLFSLKFNSMNSFVSSFVNSLMILSKNPNNKYEWYFKNICKYKYEYESVDKFNWIGRWFQMNSLMNLNEFVNEFK